MIKLTVNEKEYKVDVLPDVPLLWVIREYLKLTGTKYVCGMGLFILTGKPFGHVRPL